MKNRKKEREENEIEGTRIKDKHGIQFYTTDISRPNPHHHVNNSMFTKYIHCTKTVCACDFVCICMRVRQ